MDRYKGIPLSELHNPKKITKRQTDLILLGSMSEKAVRHWWTTKNIGLDGLTPEQAWKDNKAQVYKIALRHLDPRYDI